MKKLFIETKDGALPIEGKIAEKYSLEKGTKSPFTGGRIVGENGDFAKAPPKEKDCRATEKSPKEDHTAEDRDGTLFTTSEIIDLASGADSPQNDR